MSSDALNDCVELVRKDFDSWIKLVHNCPSTKFFKDLVLISILKVIADSMNEANESELARKANMNRQTLSMFIRRIFSKGSHEFFWGVEPDKRVRS